MSNVPPHRPLRQAREVVGPEREDVSAFTDRSIVVRALDVALRTHEEVRAIRLGVRLELDDVQERLKAAEHSRPHVTADPFPTDDDDDREPSIHEWNKILAEAGHTTLSRRVREGKIDSERARAIAEEAAKKVWHEAHVAEELTTWRRLKGLGPMIGKGMLKALIPFVAGGIVVELLKLMAWIR